MKTKIDKLQTTVDQNHVELLNALSVKPQNPNNSKEELK
jgi:hypothetical protein